MCINVNGKYGQCCQLFIHVTCIITMYIYITCLKQIYTHVTVFNMHFCFISNYSLHENNQTLDRIRYFTIVIKILEYMF